MSRTRRLLSNTVALVLVVSVGYAKSSASTVTEPSHASASDGAPKTMVAIAGAHAIGNAKQGSIIYAERCGLCHNAGGMGPSLKGENNRKDSSAIVEWIKNPQPPMPKLYPSRLSERDVNDVAAYVQTLAGPPAGSPASAPGHASGTNVKTVVGSAAAGSAAQGKALYGQRCASCHGATGTEGGAGPSLKGEKNRKNQAATVTWIKNPSPPMPKLYPSPLGEKEVRDIAAYVQTL